MADFEFEITSGGYAGRYELDLVDFTAAEASAFRQALGISLATVVSDGSADIDAVAGLVWLVKRRTAKGLPYAMVADQISYGNVSPLVADAVPGEDGSLDPTTQTSNDSG